MKFEQTFAACVSVYLVLHILLAADAIPQPLRPLAKAIENEDLTKISGVVLDGLFRAV